MSWEALALLLAIAGFGVAGLLTRRAAIALIPAATLIAFLGVMLTSNEWYSRVPEETQAFISFLLIMAVAAEITGVLVARISRS